MALLRAEAALMLPDPTADVGSLFSKRAQKSTVGPDSIIITAPSAPSNATAATARSCCCFGCQSQRWCHVEVFPLQAAPFCWAVEGVDWAAHLVSHVEEGEELLLLHDSADLLPLFGCRVNACWVVSTRVQQHYILGRRCLHPTWTRQSAVFRS